MGLAWCRFGLRVFRWGIRLVFVFLFAGWGVGSWVLIACGIVWVVGVSATVGFWEGRLWLYGGGRVVLWRRRWLLGTEVRVGSLPCWGLAGGSGVVSAPMALRNESSLCDMHS